jgi:hypothetical protein
MARGTRACVSWRWQPWRGTTTAQCCNVGHAREVAKYRSKMTLAKKAVAGWVAWMMGK